MNNFAIDWLAFCTLDKSNPCARAVLDHVEKIQESSRHAYVHLEKSTAHAATVADPAQMLQHPAKSDKLR